MPSISDDETQTYCDLATAIIQKQAAIIGQEIAIKKAKSLNNLVLDDEGQVLAVYGKPLKTLELLVMQYSKISGDTAVQFCREAIQPIVRKYPDLDLPKILEVSPVQAPTIEQFLQSF